MRNDLVGNVADYFKCGLLRHLAGRSDDDGGSLRLGVVWFLDASPRKASKGTKWDYLSDEQGEFKQCDPVLFERIKTFANPEFRDVENVASWKLLPETTLFCSKPLPGAHDSEAVSNGRKHARDVWLRGALDRTAESDVVFLDPNKGLEAKRPRPSEKKAIDYCFYSEALSFWEREQSLVLFQSCGRNGPVRVQIDARVNELQEHLSGARFVEPIYFYTHGVLFFIVVQAKHAGRVKRRLNIFADKWQRYLKSDLQSSQSRKTYLHVKNP